KRKTQKEREPAAPVPDGKRRWVDRKQEHAEQTIEMGDEGIAEQEPQAKLFPRRPLVQRLAAKRHDDSGKFGQRHRNLSGGRQGFTWFHRFGLDRIQLARTNTNFGRVGCLERFRSLAAVSASPVPAPVPNRHACIYIYDALPHGEPEFRSRSGPREP